MNDEIGETQHGQAAPAAAEADMNFLRFMPAFVRDLHSKGVGIRLNPQTFEIEMDGFYGNGPMRLTFKDNGGNFSFLAVDRNKKETPIKSFMDLVTLNYDWWRAANTRGRYMAPAKPWLDHFLEHGLAKRSVIIVPKDTEEGQ